MSHMCVYYYVYERMSTYTCMYICICVHIYIYICSYVDTFYLWEHTQQYSRFVRTHTHTRIGRIHFDR